MDRCSCAPLGVKCVYDVSPHCMSCYVHNLYYDFQELLRSMPLGKMLFEPYICPQFEIEKESKNNNE